MFARRRQERKIIVAIPTCDRPPQYLNSTVRSVARHAAEFKHDVEVVVSDTSTNNKFADTNKKAVEKIAQEFGDSPSVKIHYYGPQLPEPIELLLSELNNEEKSDYEAHVPKDGTRGAHRNRLALLAVYHGGENAAYLHLDDDTPLLALTAEKTVTKNKRDVLGAFLIAFERAIRCGKLGASGAVFGVPDSYISRGEAAAEVISGQKIEKNLGRVLKSLLPLVHFPGHRNGPGRILSFEAMKRHYRPYVFQEDKVHSQLVEPEGYYRAHKPAFVLHIGTIGSNPAQPRTYSSDRVVENDFKPWNNLIVKMAKLGLQARSQ